MHSCQYFLMLYGKWETGKSQSQIWGEHFYSTEATLQHIVIRIATHEATRNSNTVKLLYSYKLSILSGQILCLGIANAIVKKTRYKWGCIYSHEIFQECAGTFPYWLFRLF